MNEPGPASRETLGKKIKLVAGGVYILRDQAVSIPDGDKAGKRRLHEFRVVVLLSNQTVCNSNACPVVSIVPLSSKLIPRAETDLVLTRSEKNGLKKDSRIMFGYLQPVMKDEFERQVGQLDDLEWENVMAKIVWNFDR